MIELMKNTNETEALFFSPNESLNRETYDTSESCSVKPVWGEQGEC